MPKFLEPVYLNEKMALNCAGYLFGGVAFESEETETTEGKVNASASASIPLLKLLNPFGAQLAGERSTGAQKKLARRLTIGSLHMRILEELQKRKMISQVHRADFEKIDPEALAYVDVIAVLRPIDFQSIVTTLKTVGPLFFQLLKDLGPKMLPATLEPKSKNKIHDLSKNAEKYEETLSRVLTQLEADYQTSKQLEMVMWTDEPESVPFGIVDLDMADSKPAEVRARISEGRFHIIGKMMSRVSEAGALSLMHRTVLASVMDIVERLARMPDNQEGLIKYQTGVGQAQSAIEKVCMLRVPGPAIRVAAMSVCI